MNESNATSGQPEQTPTRAAGCYDQISAEQLEAAADWLSAQGTEAWSKRFRVDGDAVYGDLRGIPPVVRTMLRSHFEAMPLMDRAQWAAFKAGTVEDRIELVDQVLTEAGR